MLHGFATVAAQSWTTSCPAPSELCEVSLVLCQVEKMLPVTLGTKLSCPRSCGHHAFLRLVKVGYRKKDGCRIGPGDFFSGANIGTTCTALLAAVAELKHEPC